MRCFRVNKHLHRETGKPLLCPALVVQTLYLLPNDTEILLRPVGQLLENQTPPDPSKQMLGDPVIDDMEDIKHQHQCCDSDYCEDRVKAWG